MYIWTGPGFRSPALLFYAGPTYFEGVDEISDGENGTEVCVWGGGGILYVWCVHEERGVGGE